MSGGKMMNRGTKRSDDHPCYYRVGKWRGYDAYWHPQQGYYAWVDDFFVNAEPGGIDFFPENADLDIIWRGVLESYGCLREAMDAELAGIVDAYGERQARIDAEISCSDQGKELAQANVAFAEEW